MVRHASDTVFIANSTALLFSSAVVTTFICLAAFEGDEYYKVTVTPQLSDATTVDALMYVWHERCEAIKNSPVVLACQRHCITLHASGANAVFLP